MSGYSVVTYATHAEGMFDDLKRRVSNLVVGGFGDTWRGVVDEIAFVRAYAGAQSSDHVVVYVDGFDTRVVRHPSVAVRRFQQELPTCRVLLSYGTNESEMSAFKRRIFGVRHGPVASCGLMMGYAKDLHDLLQSVEATAVSDAERALNLVLQAERTPTVRVDVERRIFRNLSHEELRSASPPAGDAVFLGYNGTIAKATCRTVLGRASRFVPEVATCVVGLAVGAVAPFCIDRSYRCNGATAAFGVALPLVVAPLVARSPNDVYTHAVVLLVSVMLAFHVAHLLKTNT